MEQRISLIVTGLLWVCLAGLAGCDGNNGSTSAGEEPWAAKSSYGALITSDEDMTTVEVQRYLYSASESPTIETLYNFTMPYGALKFLTGQGSVPNVQAALPERCYQSQTLGIGDVMDCWANPVIDRLKAFSEQNGLSSKDMKITMQLPTNVDETRPEYPLEQTGQLLDTAGWYFDTQGFNAKLIEEPNTDIPTYPLAGYPIAYNHSSTPDIQKPDWMSRLPKGRRLNELSLPGTHDTISRFGGGCRPDPGFEHLRPTQVRHSGA